MVAVVLMFCGDLRAEQRRLLGFTFSCGMNRCVPFNAGVADLHRGGAVDLPGDGQVPVLDVRRVKILADGEAADALLIIQTVRQSLRRWPAR